MSRAGAGAWTEPGAFPIAPGIHRLPLPLRDDGLKGVNVYAIEDGDGVALIDGGWAIPEAFDVLAASLNSIGYRPGDVTRTVVTHAHIDHYTLAVRLRTEYGAPVAVGRGERDSLTWITGHGPRHGFQAAQLLTAGAPQLAEYMSRKDPAADPVAESWELPDVWLGEGEIKIGQRTLRVLETPGHTQGHIVLWLEDEELLFSGDQILPHITPSIGFESVPQPQPLVSFLDSLGRVRQLPDARLLPAHGPADARVHARIDELVEHHRRRLDQTRSAVARLASATAAEVAQELPWTRHERTFAELDLFNRTLAVTETRAHLAFLVHRGEVAASADDVVLYSVVA
ncbi:MBL fold metallo-hydrolase [Dactylosporangium sp. NPDC048998]|uniref:MBL fold metallo-hydrolase n=1 Tax=Dactylosporangium sp. NPDC048998 TaxID=3363976 RepID=UPI00372015F5